MLSIKPMLEEDYHFLVDWNEGKDGDYLYQWSGKGIYNYPITIEQIKVHAKDEGSQIYLIFDGENPVGSVELENINKEDLSANVTRFILNEQSKNKSYGTLALKQLVNITFTEMGIKKLTLKAFCFNVGAIRCYEKVGFLVKEFHKHENPKWNFYTMELTK